MLNMRYEFVVRLLLLTGVCALVISACPKAQPRTLPLVVSSDPAANEAYDDAVALEEDAPADAATAHESFQREHADDPLAALSAVRLGKLRLAAGDTEGAVAVLEPQLEHEDQSVAELARLYLGVARQLEGRPDDAIELLEPLRGTTTDPEHTELLYETLGVAHESGGDSTHAVSAYDAMLEEPVSDEAKERARASIQRLIGSASSEELEAMLVELDPQAGAYRTAAETLTRDAFRRGDLLAVYETANLLEAAGVELTGELRDMRLRAERTQRVDFRSIGAVLPMSGRGRAVGQDALYAINLAAAENGARVFFRDSAGDPSRAVEAVNDLVTIHQVAAIIGPPSSQVARAAARRAQELGVPYLSLSPDAELTSIGEYVFRYLSSLDEEMRALARATAEQGVTQVAILRPNTGAGNAIASAFRTAAESAGLTVSTEEVFESGATSFRDQVTAIARSTPQAVFVPTNARTLALIAPSLAAVGLWPSSEQSAARLPRQARPIRLVVPAGAYNAALFERNARYLEGALVAVPFDTSAAHAGAFVDAFEAEHARAPGIFAAAAYDLARHIVDTGESVSREGGSSRTDLLSQLSPFVIENAVYTARGLSEMRTPAELVRVREFTSGTLQAPTQSTSLDPS